MATKDDIKLVEQLRESRDAISAELGKSSGELNPIRANSGGSRWGVRQILPTRHHLAGFTHTL